MTITSVLDLSPDIRANIDKALLETVGSVLPTIEGRGVTKASLRFIDDAASVMNSLLYPWVENSPPSSLANAKAVALAELSRLQAIYLASVEDGPGATCGGLVELLEAFRGDASLGLFPARIAGFFTQVRSMLLSAHAA